MMYLLAEIWVGLFVVTVLGFCLGWVLRGVRERIRKQ